MSEHHPPNPIIKAAEKSSLPRAERARIGQTTEPVPEGKVLAAEPHHHFKVIPEDHEGLTQIHKVAEELGTEPREQEHTRHTRDHVPLRSALQSGTDFPGTATQVNKQMPSTHRRADTGGKLSKGGGK